LEWGSVSVRWYGTLITAAIVIGVILSQRIAVRRGVDPQHIPNLMGWLILGAIPMARLYYVVFAWQSYRTQPWWEIFAVWHGGIAIHGALLGGGIALALFVRKHSLNFWQLVDTIMPAVILGQAIGRWGNFFNHEAYGRAIDPNSRLWIMLQLPDGSLVHPTFLYESIWNLGVFVLLFYLAWRKPHLKAGAVFATYLIGYSLGRFWIEALRTDSLMLGPLRVAQVVSLAMILAGGVIWVGIYRWQKPDDLALAAPSDTSQDP
jgi:phosphatidylglycerol:prolipoprotein diacylglycerol transferase